MNQLQRTMIRRIADLAVSASDEGRAHLDRFHAKREALEKAELELGKARARCDDMKARLYAYPKDRRERVESEVTEELRDAENAVEEIKATMARLDASMHEIAPVRDRARKLSEALLRVSKTKHPEISTQNVGSLRTAAP